MSWHAGCFEDGDATETRVRRKPWGGAVNTAPSVSLRRKLILLVEDESASSEALACLLSARYDVMVACDGVQGFEMATESQPDLIITDITMPRLDGLAMVRLIRARMTRKTPVIFLTARNTAADVIAGISAGARHYLTKPVDAVDLENCVARAIGA
jgi:DNA-binding response OmpR family regulator